MTLGRSFTDSGPSKILLMMKSSLMPKLQPAIHKLYQPSSSEFIWKRSNTGILEGTKTFRRKRSSQFLGCYSTLPVFSRTCHGAAFIIQPCFQYLYLPMNFQWWKEQPQWKIWIATPLLPCPCLTSSPTLCAGSSWPSTNATIFLQRIGCWMKQCRTTVQTKCRDSSSRCKCWSGYRSGYRQRKKPRNPYDSRTFYSGEGEIRTWGFSRNWAQWNTKRRNRTQ